MRGRSADALQSAHSARRGDRTPGFLAHALVRCGQHKERSDRHYDADYAKDYRGNCDNKGPCRAPIISPEQFYKLRVTFGPSRCLVFNIYQGQLADPIISFTRSALTDRPS